MTRTCAILTLAAALALAGCESEQVGYNNTINTPQRADQPIPGSGNLDRTTANAGDVNSQSIRGESSYSRSDNNNVSGTGVPNPSGNAGAPDYSRSNTNNQPDYNRPNNNVAGTGINNSNNNEQIVQGRQPDDPSVRLNNDKNAVPPRLSDSDLTFVKEAHAGGLFEVSASERALLKSDNTQIKTLAQHMIDDHTKANNQLADLAANKGERSLPGMSDAQSDELAQLDKANGSDFDREYIRQQKSSHEDAINKFQQAANSAQDKDLRDWAAKTLPTLRDHLNMINSITASPSADVGK